jgi:hypothetical protein
VWFDNVARHYLDKNRLDVQWIFKYYVCCIDVPTLGMRGPVLELYRQYGSPATLGAFLELCLSHDEFEVDLNEEWVSLLEDRFVRGCFHEHTLNGVCYLATLPVEIIDHQGYVDEGTSSSKLWFPYTGGMHLEAHR